MLELSNISIILVWRYFKHGQGFGYIVEINTGEFIDLDQSGFER